MGPAQPEALAWLDGGRRFVPTPFDAFTALLRRRQRATDGDDGTALAGRLEAAMLGSERRYTRAEASAMAGIALERAIRLWRALGFADVGDDQKVFTESDVEALRTAVSLTESGVISPDAEASMTRALGQALSRLADWQAGLLAELIVDDVEEVSADETVRSVEELLPMLEQIQTYAWRRHLAAAAGRFLAGSDEELDSRELAVGFADIVGFTKISRRLDQRELTSLIDSFEATATDLVTGHGGRVVKTIGDEVCFAAESATAAAQTAVGLVEQINTSVPGRPNVRVGVAYGEVVTRFGDVYGPVVNLASRLTSLAKPGTVLVDRELAAVLEPHPDFEPRPGPARAVRDYPHLRPYRLHRARSRSDCRRQP